MNQSIIIYLLIIKDGLLQFVWSIIMNSFGDIYKRKYKTILCNNWRVTQSCPLGLRCLFAHGHD